MRKRSQGDISNALRLMVVELRRRNNSGGSSNQEVCRTDYFLCVCVCDAQVTSSSNNAISVNRKRKRKCRENSIEKVSCLLSWYGRNIFSLLFGVRNKGNFR